jgi:hypothetical protein
MLEPGDLADALSRYGLIGRRRQFHLWVHGGGLEELERAIVGAALHAFRGEVTILSEPLRLALAHRRL